MIYNEGKLIYEDILHIASFNAISGGSDIFTIETTNIEFNPTIRYYHFTNKKTRDSYYDTLIELLCT